MPAARSGHFSSGNSCSRPWEQHRKNTRPWQGIWLSPACRLTLALGPRKHATRPIRSIDAIERSHSGIWLRISHFSIGFVHIERIDIYYQKLKIVVCGNNKITLFFLERIDNFIVYFLMNDSFTFLYTPMQSKYCIEIHDELNLHGQVPRNEWPWLNEFLYEYTMCFKLLTVMWAYNYKISFFHKNVLKY